jgi:capsular exopolysaccharide synthesis family protein
MKMRKKSKKESGFPEGLFLHWYPINSRFAEAYRTLRTNIDFSFMDGDCRSLLITSSGEEEGKTLTVANLACVMSRMGKSVLMIDADLRKPTLSGLCTSYDSPGLTGLLTDLFSTEVRKGSIGEFTTSDLYRLLSLQKKTGLLRLSGGREDVELFFLKGDLVDLHWPTRPEEKKLATVLMKNNLLINMGLLKEEDLSGCLTIHMMEGLRTALNFKAGNFVFKELPASNYERASFDPIDFKNLYRQVIMGQEELPFLQKLIDAAVVQTDIIKNLYILPTGKLPPNPSELLGSERMSFLLSSLMKRFDLVVIDTPPVLPASDALILAPQTDGVVLLIKAGLVNRNLIIKTIEQLELARANLIGVVLNDVDIKKDGYYRYYHKYYSKYYGDNE